MKSRGGPGSGDRTDDQPWLEQRLRLGYRALRHRRLGRQLGHRGLDRRVERHYCPRFPQRFRQLDGSRGLSANEHLRLVAEDGGLQVIVGQLGRAAHLEQGA